MTIQCNYTDVQELAHAVAESGKLTARPYNQYEPTQADWYLVPSKEWPAYPLGKGILQAQKRHWSQADVLGGLLIEKGFGRNVSQVDPWVERQGRVLDEKWVWHAFLRDLSAGRVSAAAQEIVQSTGEAVLLEISAYTINFGGAESAGASGGQGWERVEYVRFQIDADGYRLLEADQAEKFLAAAARCSHAEELAGALHTHDLEWVWIDFCAGIEISRSRADAAPAQIWSPADIWKKALRPWLPWIR
jgi:hypothetical protein